MSRSLWRNLLYEELESVSLSGLVLDLGGLKNSVYHGLIKGEQEWEVANLDDSAEADYRFDFEHQFPVQTDRFDAVVCINVLEHIYNYRNVLKESQRSLKPGGTLVLAVPFLIKVHPSPNDYWRFTGETLEKILSEAGFQEIDIRPIGTGVFGASYSLRHGLYRIGLLQRFLMIIATAFDRCISKLRPGRNSFTKEYYPLGYLVTAKK